MMKKRSTSERIQEAAKLRENIDGNLLHRWLSNAKTQIEMEGKKHHPTKYVDRADCFTGLCDADDDPVADVLAFFTECQEMIADHYAKLDAEDQSRKDAEAKAARERAKIANRQMLEREQARIREQQELLASQAVARREAAEREAQSESAPSKKLVLPSPTDEAFMSFEGTLLRSLREQNLERLMSGVSGLLGYADTEQLRHDDAALYDIVKNTCSHYKWRKDLLIEVDWQAENIRNPSRAVFDKVIYPKLNESQKARTNSRSTLSDESVLEHMSSSDLSVHNFLIANAPRDFTYNQIAHEIGEGWQLVAKECRRLVRDQTSGVVQAKRTTPKGTSEVFCYSPQRKQIETGVATSDAVIKQVLIHLISEYPAQSQRQLAERARRQLMSMADHSFRSALSDLIATGEVVVKPGLRRANLHFLAS